MSEEEAFDYRKSVEEVEHILERIESGELDIDELSAMVKRAAELIKQCRKKLRDTENNLEKTLNDLEE